MVKRRKKTKTGKDKNTDKNNNEKKTVKKVFLGPVPADCSDLGIETKPEYVVPSALLKQEKKGAYKEDEPRCPVCGERLILSQNGEWVCPNCGLVVRQATLEEFTGEMEIGGEAYSPTPEKIEKYVAFSYSDRDLFVILNAVYEELYGSEYEYINLIETKESVAGRWNQVLKRWADEWPNHKCNIALLYKSLAEIFLEREAAKLGLDSETIEQHKANINKKLSKVRPWELRFRCSSNPRGDPETCKKWLRNVLGI